MLKRKSVAIISGIVVALGISVGLLLSHHPSDYEQIEDAARQVGTDFCRDYPKTHMADGPGRIERVTVTQIREYTAAALVIVRFGQRDWPHELNVSLVKSNGDWSVSTVDIPEGITVAAGRRSGNKRAPSR